MAQYRRLRGVKPVQTTRCAAPDSRRAQEAEITGNYKFFSGTKKTDRQSAGPLEKGLQHQAVDVRAVLFIQRDETGDGALTSVAPAQGFDQHGNILFLRAEFRKILRHADGGEEVPQLFTPLTGGDFRMGKVHLAAPDTDGYLRKTHYIMIHEGPRVIADPDNYDARANIMWAGMMAHNNSCGVGRSQDWISHDIEHELSALYDCAHGAGLAVTFPAYLSYAYKHDVARVAQFARRVWGCPEDIDDEEAALMGIESLREFFNSIGMPSTIGEFGGTEGDIDKLAHTACYGNGRDGKLRGFVEVDEDAVKEIYRRML